MTETHLATLVQRTRSYRRFRQDPIPLAQLRALVDLGRLCASGGNLQPLKYLIAADPATNARIFPCTKWAAHLKDWPGPAEGERPTAYIVILHDTTMANTPGCDHGIAAQTILLGAMEQGIGGCMIGSLDRARLAAALGLPDHLQILLALALGQPGETIVLEDVGPDGDTRYWRTPDGVHHVPKRSLDAVLVPVDPAGANKTAPRNV